MSNQLCIHPHFHLQAERLFHSISNKKKLEAYSSWMETQTGPTYSVDEGVAEIPIVGPLYECEPWLEFFGICSYQRIRKQVYEANLDANVRGIKLRLNSPGGGVDGVFETQKVLSSSAKPIIEAEVMTICASAAYLLASTAQRITAGAHSTVGSIGTILTYYGDKGFLAKLGITRTTLVSSVSPYKNDDPEDVGDEGRQRLQAWIDKLGDVFVERIAQLRKVPLEKVLADYGKGGVFVGIDSLNAGMIDGLSDVEPTPGGDMAETTTTTTTETETNETEAADSGEPMEEGEGTVEGTDRVGKELDRLQAIDDLKIAGHDDLVYKAKYTDKVSAETLKAWVFDAERGRKTAKQGAFHAAAKTQKEKPIASANPDEAALIQENEQLRAMAKEAAKHRR